MKLRYNDVFVFGTNESGFHGAGGAGFAWSGDSSNSWRQNPDFLRALNSPVGDEVRVGLRAVLGQSRGLMLGKEGFGYGICTTKKPGAKRSVPLVEIQEQIRELIAFAKSRPELCFRVSNFGSGYAGYSKAEIEALWTNLGEIPGNIVKQGYSCN